MLRIFEEKTSVSLYLQTSCTGFAIAFGMVKNTTGTLFKIQRDFDTVYQAAVNFASVANEELYKKKIEIQIETMLCQTNKRNRMDNSNDRFRIKAVLKRTLQKYTVLILVLF